MTTVNTKIYNEWIQKIKEAYGSIHATVIPSGDYMSKLKTDYTIVESLEGNEVIKEFATPLNGGWLHSNNAPGTYTDDTYDLVGGSTNRDGRLMNYSQNVLKVLPVPPHINLNTMDLKKTPLLGAEVEVSFPREPGRSKVTQAFELFNNLAIIKSDGSLTQGFEITTLPLTYADHKAMFPTSFKQDLDIRAHSSCGMHVHISRDSFTTDQIRKFLAFYNAANNKDFIVGVAERQSSFATRESQQDILADSLTSYNRQAYVNTRGAATLEVRIFASPLTKHKYLKNLEFVLATHRFACHTSKYKLSAGDFLRYLKGKETLYPNLCKFFKDRASAVAGSDSYLKKICSVYGTATSSTEEQTSWRDKFNAKRTKLALQKKEAMEALKAKRLEQRETRKIITSVTKKLKIQDIALARNLAAHGVESIMDQLCAMGTLREELYELERKVN